MLPSMPSTHLVRSSRQLVVVLAVTLLAGCGGTSGERSATNAIEQHVVAKEEFGVMLADIRTSADLAREKPALLRKAQAIVDSIAAMEATVLDNPRLSDAEKGAAIEPFQMRLAAADRLWIEETERITRSLGASALDDVGAVLSKTR
jgi:hypothetical protein